MDDTKERADFEAWLNPGAHAGNVSPWVEPGRYEKDAHNLAWLAWQARAALAAQGVPADEARRQAQAEAVKLKGDILKIDAAIRKAGLTLVRTASGYEARKFGEVAAQATPPQAQQVGRDPVTVYTNRGSQAQQAAAVEQRYTSEQVARAWYEVGADLVGLKWEKFAKELGIGATPPQAPQAAEHEREMDAVLAERDAASDYIDALLDEVLGKDRPEWSSNYGHADAMDEVRERMAAMMKPTIDKAWARFEAVAAPPQAPQAAPLTDEQIEAIGHRKAWRYKHSSDPAHSSTYTFNRVCLLDFARVVIDAARDAERGIWASSGSAS